MIGKKQLNVMESLVERSGDWIDFPVPSWVYGTVDATRKILDQLVEKGFVKKATEYINSGIGDRIVYRPLTLWEYMKNNKNKL